MKKSEFKEYLKTEILRMQEATDEEINKQKELNKELEKTKELTSTMENKITKSEFKEYLRNEILREINEQEEDDIELDGGDVELGDLEGEEEIEATVDPGESDKALALI